MKCSIFDKEFDPYDCIGDITSYDDDSKAERYAEFKHNANCEQEDTSIEDNAAPYFLKKCQKWLSVNIYQTIKHFHTKY